MNIKISKQTYYEVLEVSPSTPHHEIVSAYQRAKEAYSPDSIALYSMFSPDEATELRNLVEEAFQTLGNPAKRKAYDNSLTGKPSRDIDLLPDFEPIHEVEMKKSTASSPATHTAQTMRPSSSAATTDSSPQRPGTVPAGFARSRVSVYEVNNAIEEEIKKQTQFDGAFLKKIRQYKNINIDQMSKETRISRSYLVAIEAEDFEALPAPVFLRGFIIQYARVLGINENLAASSYMSRVKKG